MFYRWRLKSMMPSTSLRPRNIGCLEKKGRLTVIGNPIYEGCCLFHHWNGSNLYRPIYTLMTEKQQYIYTIIDSWWNRYGFAPSIQNIMDITGDKSKGNIHRIIIRLCELGHCKRLPNTARSVRPSYIKMKRPK